MEKVATTFCQVYSALRVFVDSYNSRMTLLGRVHCHLYLFVMSTLLCARYLAGVKMLKHRQPFARDHQAPTMFEPDIYAVLF